MLSCVSGSICLDPSKSKIFRCFLCFTFILKLQVFEISGFKLWDYFNSEFCRHISFKQEFDGELVKALCATCLESHISILRWIHFVASVFLKNPSCSRQPKLEAPQETNTKLLFRSLYCFKT